MQDKRDKQVTEGLKAALDQANEQISQLNERMVWIQQNLGTADEETLREQLGYLHQDMVQVDEKRTVELEIAYDLLYAVEQKREEAVHDRVQAELQADELMRALMTERARRGTPEQAVAKRIVYQMDLSDKDAQTLVDLLTGDLEVYLSIFTMEDLAETIGDALDEIRQTRADMDADGGVAD